MRFLYPVAHLFRHGLPPLIVSHKKWLNASSLVAANVLVKNKCILLECKGEGNHIHLLLDIHPDNNISTLLGSIKSATSRILRKDFESELRPHFKNWSKGLWGDQLYIRSAGGAPLKILEEYIQSHSRG